MFHLGHCSLISTESSIKVIASPNTRGSNNHVAATMIGTRRSLAAGIETSVGWRRYSFRGAHLLFEWLSCDRGATQGSAGSKFSLAHCRANRLSSAAVYKLSLCLIFSQWVSIVLRLR